MRSMYQVLSKQERLQVASEGGTVEIRVPQFIRQWVPSCWRSHGKGTTTIRVQLEPWGDEQVVAGWTEMLLFSDLSNRHAQLRQVVGRLAVKTLVCHPAEMWKLPKCGNFPRCGSFPKFRNSSSNPSFQLTAVPTVRGLPKSSPLQSLADNSEMV